MPPLRADNFDILEPAQPSLNLRLDEHDGDAVKRFAKDGRYEIWLVSPYRDEEGIRMTFCLPVSFATRQLAQQAATTMREAISLVNELAATGPVEGPHQHTVVLERFSRSIPFEAACVSCGARYNGPLAELQHVGDGALRRRLLGANAELADRGIVAPLATLREIIEEDWNHRPVLRLP